MAETASRSIDEYWIETHQGRIFAKAWRCESIDRLLPIILFHDSLGCVDLWRDFPERLSTRTGRDVIAYDRLGYGRSDELTLKPSPDFIESEARLFLPSILDALKLQHFIACGHSVGGGMAVGAAAHFRGACKALVTISAQSFVEQGTIDGIRRAQTEFERAENFARLRKHHGSRASWVLDAFFSTWLSPSFRDWRLTQTLKKIRCPLLAIHGDRDEYGSLDQARRMARGRGTVQILEDTGHFPHRERPDLLTNTIEEWLEKSSLL